MRRDKLGIGKFHGRPMSALGQHAKDMLDQLTWWTNALKAAREKAELRAA
jgi:hypothetical protein